MLRRANMSNEWLREEAARLGFSRVGVVRSGPLPGGERCDEWLRRGFHGEMTWIERQVPKRRDPSLILSGVRSMVVVAMDYYPGNEPPRTSLQGNVSRYARGRDYHDILGSRLDQLRKAVAVRHPEARGLWYVDSGPVAEKAWASHSSIGWLGKHSNVVAQEHGSWFFLGVLLLDVELEYDAPQPDRCGTCERCVRACPTGAIVAPYVVDATRCISYLTIEMRGPIPRDLRPVIGNRIFGCDDCQEVCPWNRFAVPAAEPELTGGPENAAPRLAELVALTTEEFAERYRATPVWRARRDGFVRNVAVALGNSASPDAVEPLEWALDDPSPLVRLHAGWALGRLGGARARAALEHALAGEGDPAVRDEIHAALLLRR
jgi:epoxyqueuosine reductase